MGGSAYWSEIAQLQTLDNLLMNKQIPVTEYIKRLPAGYISQQTELLQYLEAQQQQAQLQQGLQMGTAPSQEGGGALAAAVKGQGAQAVKGGSGYGAVQRNLIEGARAGSGR